MIIVQTTTSTKKEAKGIAKRVVKKSLAGCVQISKIDSIYKWDGKVCEDKEYLLHIKAKKQNYKKIQREIKENHSYDLPEIICIKIKKSSKEYAKFIKDS
jgi:periplasmic divalent cation tolerance protein